MASVRVPITTFERGDLFPSLCAITGQRADDRLRVIAQRSPAWVWLLLVPPFTVFFVPVYIFAMERSVGRVPVSASVRRSLVRLDVVRVVLLAIAALLIPTTLIFEVVPGVIALFAIAVVALAIGVSRRRQRMSIRARLDGAGDQVVLEGVAPAFADAAGQLQPFMR